VVSHHPHLLPTTIQSCSAEPFSFISASFQIPVGLFLKNYSPNKSSCYILVLTHTRRLPSIYVEITPKMQLSIMQILVLVYAFIIAACAAPAPSAENTTITDIAAAEM
jgi:hypothetical protein